MQDIATTQQLIAAGQILGVALLDHVIVAGGEYYSFAASGMISGCHHSQTSNPFTKFRYA
jgi:hypothetical protein